MKRIVVLAKLTKGDMNPFDESALESALSFLPDAEITLISMGPLSQKERMDGLTRLGIKSLLICDPLFAGSDTVATAKVLAKAISPRNPDYVICGRQSLDGSTAQVPFMVAELLGLPVVSGILGFDKEKATLRSGETVAFPTPCLLAFEKYTALRSPSIFSKKGATEILDNVSLGFGKEEVGLLGSPTMVVASHKNEKDRRECKSIEVSDLEKTIQACLEKETKKPGESVKKAPCIHFVGDIADIALSYAKEVVHLPLEDKSLEEAKALLLEKKPAIVLFEEKEPIKELASRLAVALNNGLCADCASFAQEENRFVITRPASGGDVIADIVCKSPSSFATVRSRHQTQEDVAIVVGRGAMESMDLVRRLAERFHAGIYCTRVVADLGGLPYSSQVGLTGKTIAPKVVLLLGVSGASQTIVGIHSSQTIIAINSDPKAPVFDFADYGIVMDVHRL